MVWRAWNSAISDGWAETLSGESKAVTASVPRNTDPSPHVFLPVPPIAAPGPPRLAAAGK
jgi:hypothetical protein